MNTANYSSKNYQHESFNNYKDLNSFTAEVLSISKTFLNDIIKDFELYLQKNNQKNPEYKEHVYNFLILGSLWRIFGGKAASLGKESQRLLLTIEGLKKDKSLNTLTNPVYGILSSIITQGKNIDSYYHDFNLENLDKLLDLMDIMDDFHSELVQLKIWKNFLKTQNASQVSKYQKNILMFADWFKTYSKLVTNDYINSVDSFMYYLKLLGFEMKN